MASGSTSKLPCAFCGSKSVGVFKCEGCSQIFCRKHSNEHRDSLIHQLDEIFLEYDTLQQTTVEKKSKPNNYYHLTDQINRWEKDSIVKIQRTAKEAQEQVEKLMAIQNDGVSPKLRNLAEELQKARGDDDFIETDLRQWTRKLQELKIEIIDSHFPTVTIREDLSVKLIAKLNIVSTSERSQSDESFVTVLGDVRIDDNGRVALQPIEGNSYIRSKNEFSFGRYKFRFNMTKIDLYGGTVFGITSRKEIISKWPTSVYGWSSDGGIYANGQFIDDNTNFTNDLKDQTSFTVELLIDCDNRKIQYFNEQTGRRRELNVDLIKCPFPWQLFFYLYSPGDRVELL